MKHSWDVKLTIGLSVFIFLLLAVVSGDKLAEDLVGIISKTISVTFLIRLVLIKWVWKVLPFLEVVHGIPNVEGKWRGTFESTWRSNPESTPEAGMIEITITQPDIYSIKLTQKSGESVSHSYGEMFEKLEDGGVCFNFSYRNVPNASVRDRSQINFGSARYQLERDGFFKLSGDYWTDRRSTGKIAVVRD